MKIVKLLFLSPLLSFAVSASASDPLVNADVFNVTTCGETISEACYEAGLDLHYGKTVTKNKLAAHELFAVLCEGGMSKACHAAAMNISRYSDKPDYHRASYFQNLGCEAGLGQSCWVMGRNLEGPWDNSVKTDHDKAKRYFLRACDLGYARGCQYAEVKATGHRLRQ